MKPQTLIFLLLVVPVMAFSQPCSPDTILLETQYSIDNFQFHHPNCDEVSGVLSIEGDDIVNLNGLSVLTRIGGNLEISENLLLTDLTGLNNIEYIGGDLIIVKNDVLGSLTGLERLESVEGDLTIRENDSLSGLAGLSNLELIGGNLTIEENGILSSLYGLDNIQASSNLDMNIRLNPMLSDCQIQSICDYLSSPNGVVDIAYNAEGCNGPVQIANDCGINLSCLPFGHYYFFSQEDVDDFPVNYPGCTEINGALVINGDDIKDLEGLTDVVSISGNLAITSCDSLTDLSELINITSIGGSLHLWGNKGLNSLSGLDNVTSIGDLMFIYEK